ncbi:uncharacterized protein LOC105845670 [Hydra vulgaris]|uniref:Uncharacterized protein LOC105845670 n=1 Tax=Hydra vulgaris TaxID=6087 RepID=A0ABM4C0H4_HYDVU
MIIFDISFLYFALFSCSNAYQAFLFGDLGDENVVSVKKSAIPNVNKMQSVEVGNLLPDETNFQSIDKNLSSEEITSEHTNFYPGIPEQKLHEVKVLNTMSKEPTLNNQENPLNEKNYISNGFVNNDLGFMQKRNFLYRGLPHRAPLSPQEVVALHAIKKIIEPSSAHERLTYTEQPNQARNLIFRQKAVSIAKALRSPRIKSFLGINRPLWPISSKLIRSNFVAGKKSNIFNSPTLNKQMFQYLQTKDRYYPLYTSGQELHPIGQKLNKYLYPSKKSSQSLSKNPLYKGLPFNIKTNPMIDKRMFAHGNFRIQSYPSETKNVKNYAKIHGSPIKTFSEKKRVWLPYPGRTKKRVINEQDVNNIYREINLANESHNLKKDVLKPPLEGNSLRYPMNWSDYKEYSAPTWLASLKKVIQPAESFIKRDEVEFPIMNKKETTNASKKQLPFYHPLSTTFPVISAFLTQPGQIPWDYYNPEYLPDGRIRPPLYPISKYLRPGTCLPESSLCDKGRHEQCCGAATFCTDFWGISKCLAHQKLNENDYHNPLQIEVNNFMKSNYNFWLAALNYGF